MPENKSRKITNSCFTPLDSSITEIESGKKRAAIPSVRLKERCRYVSDLLKSFSPWITKIRTKATSKRLIANSIADYGHATGVSVVRTFGATLGVN